MNNDNTDTTCDGDDALGELKPIGHIKARMSRMSQQRGGPLGFLASTFHRSSLFSNGSNSTSSGSTSSSDTRITRFNDRPVCESPMLAARDYFVRASNNGSQTQTAPFEFSFEPNTKNGSSKSVLTDRSLSSERSNGSKESETKRLDQDAKNRIETTKELFQRRMKRIDPKFFEENPIQKVPRFGPNELKLGDILGKGEFGSVFAIESLERQPLPPLDYKKVIMESEAGAEHRENTQGAAPGAPVGVALTLPVATDLIVGKGNLDNFLRRRVEGFEEQPVPPAVMEEEIQPTNKSQHLLGSFVESERSLSNSMRRRPGLAITDKKEQMINRQNNVENFDGYVVKVVRDDISNERKKCVAAADMAAEAKLLSALSHRNIIRIRGIMGYVERPQYGIIMDKLQSTLQDQIHEWAKVTSEDNVPKAAPQHRNRIHAPKWMLGQHEKEAQKKRFRQTEFFVERMEAVLDVAEAMKYLHEKRIIFRDLKPENVGLTNGNYVLFDFGLSRELTDSDRVGGGAEDKYRATGLTGSRLFMAPEVAKKMPYGFSADVFSFAILFWEVVSLAHVFPTMTMNKHYKMVIVKGKRPRSLEDILPPELNGMMEASWDKDPSIRPSFESICQILIDELKKQGSKSSSTNKHSSWLNFSPFVDDTGASSRSIVSSALGKVQETVTKLTPKIPSM